MATRFIFKPGGVQWPATASAQYKTVNERLVVAFDPGSTAESCYWETVAPQGITGTWTAVISYFMDTGGTSGGVAFDISVEAVTGGDSTNLASSSSFDTANTGYDSAVPGTAGYMEQISITLTYMDSVTQGDILRFKLTRNTGHANDTCAYDCFVIALEIRDGA